MDDQLHVRVLRTDRELESIREQWTRLHHHPNADPEFFSAIAEIRPEILAPCVIAVARDGEPQTLLIGRVERTEAPLKVGYWKVGRLRLKSLVIPYGGMVGDLSAEPCRLIMRQIDDCLRAKEFDVAFLHFAPEDSEMRRLFGLAPVLRRDYFEEASQHWVMELPSDMEGVYERMSSKRRKTLKYKARRLEKQFDSVEVRYYESAIDLERVMGDAESIAQTTYQRGLGVGFRASRENRERFQMEMQRGGFRGYFLYLDDKPVAFFMGTLHKNVLYDDFQAFDPGYAAASPGTYLFLKLLEHACEAGIGSIDFGVGDAEYKAQFGTETKREVTTAVFAPTLRGIRANLIRTPVHGLDRLGRAMAERLGFVRSVKKRLRDHAAKKAGQNSAANEGDSA